ncbi:hypothetical protein QNO07_23015 [Streptomyces sp. 549]|uniref:hypothetical protein n=1 Tax=Streptomyces sp. 549 TaxID=3049076 RepID=UPI0024C36BEB|nr:hypothetical protein [Streptomyces sp. 549]MDK1476254.1 hypothetical protein [Streptomyces sp. 549]
MTEQREKKRGRRWRAVAAGSVLLALAGYVVVQYKTTEGGPPRCEVRSADGEQRWELEPQMARNAAAIEAVAASRGLPDRAVTIALATAVQESTLRNIDYGDRDSVGLFQQRPSQGWGTVEQIMDPVYSAGKFYDGLVEVPGYTRLPLTVAAQEVQRSGFPQAYAKHEANAALLTSALVGRQPAALNCTTGNAQPVAGDSAEVRRKLVREFGADVLPADGVSGAGRSAPVSGLPVVSVPVPADGEGGAKAERRGWELAHWAVANATELGISRITFADRVWEAGNSAAGWRTTDGEKSTEVRMTLAQ